MKTLSGCTRVVTEVPREEKREINGVGMMKGCLLSHKGAVGGV